MTIVIWTTITILGAVSIGTLFYLGARIDSLGNSLGARIDSLAAKMDSRSDPVNADGQSVRCRWRRASTASAPGSIPILISPLPASDRMVILIDVHDAGNQLSTLIERALLGEEIVITQAGRPVAKLVPILPQARTRQPGSAKGVVVVPPDFDAPLPAAVLAEWGEQPFSTS